MQAGTKSKIAQRVRARRRSAYRKFFSSVEWLELRTLFTGTWTSLSSGFWDDAANWENGHIPNGQEDAIINQPGITVTVRDFRSVAAISASSNITVTTGANLHLDSGTISGNVILQDGQIVGTFTFAGSENHWTGGAFFGTATVTGTLALSGSADKFLGALLINNGTMHQTGGNLLVPGGARLINNGLYQLNGDTSILYANSGAGAAAEIDNNGTLRKASGTGNSDIGIAFNSSVGTIQVLSGHFRVINDASFLQAGPVFTVNPGATVEFRSMTFFNGTMSGSGGGQVIFAGGIGPYNGGDGNAVASLNFPEGMAFWTGGDIAGGSFGSGVGGPVSLYNTGYLTVNGTANKGINRNSIINLGTVVSSGPGDIYLHGLGDGIGSTFDNRAGGTVVMQGAVRFLEGGNFINGGAIIKTGSGVGQIDGVFKSAATGTIAVQDGTLNLTHGGDSTGGSFNVSSGATLAFKGGSAFFLNGTFSGSGNGTVLWEAGLSGGDQSSPAALSFPEGMLIFRDDDGVPSFGGTIYIVRYATFDTENDLAMRAGLFNQGTITHSGAGNLRVNANSYIQNDGLYIIESDAGMYVPTDGSVGTVQLVNHGILRKSGSGGTSLLRGTSGSDRLALNNSGGTVDVVSGVLAIQDQVTQLSGTTLTGGTWIIHGGAQLLFPNGSNIQTNQGVVSLGGANASFPALFGLRTNAGSLSILGNLNYTMGSLTNNGLLQLGGSAKLSLTGNFTMGPSATFAVDVSGAATKLLYGRLATTGLATLNGTLLATVSGGYGPTAAQLYTVISAGTINGSFSVFNLNSQLTANNSSTTITLKGQGDPADLVPTSVTVPGTGTSGASATISYQINNIASAAAGSWIDSLYLSKDNILDENDALIGRVTHEGGVSALGNYTESFTGKLPAVLEGDYHVIVVADSRALIADGDRDNNIAVSTSTIAMSFPSLTLGQVTQGTIAAGEDLYYAITLEAGQDLSLLANFDVPREAQMFVRFNALPGGSAFDVASTDLTSGTQQLVVHAAQSGRYFINLHGLEGAGFGENFSFTPSLAQLGISSVSPSHGSRAGSTTVTIYGSNFAPGSIVSLVSGDTQLNAGDVQFVSSNQLFATFNLSTLNTGTYGVKVSAGGSSTTLAGSFNVTDGQTGKLQYHVSAPKLIHQGKTGTVTIDYQNIGDTDLPAPLFVVTSDNARFRLPGQTTFMDDHIEVLGIYRGGSAGVLPPGASGTVTLVFEQKNTTSEATSKISAYALGRNAPMDWSLMKDDLRPDQMPSDTWNAIFSNFKTMMGTTSGQYMDVLRKNATYLSRYGTYTEDPMALLSFQIAQADAFGAISQRYTQSVFGRGQTDPYRAVASTDSRGNVFVSIGNAQRVFLRNSNGSYSAVGGDAGQLTHTLGGAYTLRDTSGQITQFLSSGLLDYYQDANGNRVTATYSGGRLSSLVTSTGDATIFTYNTKGLVSKISYPDSTSTSYTYTSGGDLFTVKTAQGTTTYTYVSSTKPALQHTLASIASSDGSKLFFQYDAFGRLSRQNGDGNTNPVTLTYDATGNPTFTDAATRSYTWFYNQFGQLAETRDALGRASRLLYDDNQRQTGALFAGGVQEVATYDASGNLTSITSPEGRTVRATYDPLSDLRRTLTDPLNHTTTFDYNAAGNQTRITDPLGRSTNFTYNSSGQLVAAASAESRGVTRNYSANGDLLLETFTDNSTVAYTYTAQHNVRTISDASGTIEFTYDALERVTKVTYADGTFVSYKYDAGSRRTEMTDHKGFTTKYGYDPQGRLSKVTDSAGNIITQYTYDSTNFVTRTDRGNGTFTTYTYDAMGNTKSIVNHAGGGSITSSFFYTYSQRDHITSMTTLEGTTTYSYDGDGQLTQAVLPGGRTLTWFYDEAGNRTAQSDTLLGDTNYTSNALNQYTVVGDTTYNYDLDGNLRTATNTAGTTTYTYNVHNQLMSITTPTDTYSYQYNALGNRIASTANGVTTRLLVDPLGAGTILGEFDNLGNAIAHYTYGLGLASRVNGSNAASYYEFDVSGNTSALTTSAGAVLNTYSYLPYGEGLTATGSGANPFTFGGQNGVMKESSGMYHMRARDYDSVTGRFTQRDPSGFQGGDINLYRYAGNSPVTFVDFTGLELTAGQRAVIDIWGHLPLNDPAADWYAAELDAEFQAAEEAAHRARMEQYLNPRPSTPPEPPSPTKPVPTEPPVAKPTTPTTPSAPRPEIPRPTVKPAIPRPTSKLAKVTQAITGGLAKAGQLYNRMPPIVKLGGKALGIIGMVDTAVTIGKIGGAIAFTQSKYYEYKVPVQESINRKKYNETIRSPFIQELINKSVEAGLGVPDKDVLDFYIKLEADSKHDTSTKNGNAHDPNDILGPAGFGTAGFIHPDQALPYHIDFENDKTAAAPAQIVYVEQQLDDDLDWTTFELGTIAFGSTLITVPAGLKSYTTSLDMGGTLRLDVVAGINLTTGLATWTLTLIDTTTGDVPEDASIGFLPPNVTSPEGEGFVTYTIHAKSSVTSGDVIDAQANIIFDTNEPILTPAIFNTIDDATPSSSVSVLPHRSALAQFGVSWSGSDEDGGSGIGHYNIYVSDNGGDAQLWLLGTTATSGTFYGAVGHQYAFYSVAVDNVGHTEDAPGSFDATTIAGVLPGVFSTLDFSGIMDLHGLLQSGTLSSDGLGSILAGGWTGASGAGARVVVGTESSYTVTSAGLINAILSSMPQGGGSSSLLTLAGAINSSRDFAALAASGALQLFLSHAGTFAAGDLAGTWSVSGDDFHGTIIVNASGAITGGTLQLASGQSAAVQSGTASIASNGLGTITLTTAFAGSQSAFTNVSLGFTLNTSKNVAAANRLNIAAGSGQLTLLVKTAAGLSANDLNGIWTFAGASGSGTFTLNKGKITGTFTDSNGSASQLGGTASISSTGLVTLKATFKIGNVTTSETFSGQLNSARNLIAVTRAGSLSASTPADVGVLINSANHAPLMPATATMAATAFQTSAITFTFSEIASALGASDVDGDALSYLLTAGPGSAGTLRVTHDGVTAAVVPGTTALVPGDTLTFVPASNAKGKVNAFSLRASDGATLSAVTTKVVVNTIPLTAVSVNTTDAEALELFAGNATANGTVTLVRSGGILSQPLTVTLAVTGTAVLGNQYTLRGPDNATLASTSATVTFPANQSSINITVVPRNNSTVDATKTVIVGVATDPNTTSPTYAPSAKPVTPVSVYDRNPSLKITAGKAIKEGESTTFTITRTAPRGGTLNTSLFVGLNYTNSTFASSHRSGPSSVNFTAGQSTATITVTTTNDGIANLAKTIVARINDSSSYFKEGTGDASISVADTSATISVAATKAASEISGATTGAGIFTLTRAGDVSAALTVSFTLAGTATEGVDYATLPVHTATFAAGKSTTTVTINPIDEVNTEGAENVVLTIVPNVGPTYFIAAAPKNAATMTIADDTRPIILTGGMQVGTTTATTPLNFSYNDLLTATGALDRLGSPISFKIVKVLTGTLTINGNTATPNALIVTGDTLTWTPPANAPTGTTSAFSLTATNGTNSTTTGTVTVLVTA